MTTDAEIAEWYDHRYWPNGVDIAGRWKGGSLGRGALYKTTGPPIPSGTPGVKRTLGGSRKARGMASDSLMLDEVQK